MAEESIKKGYDGSIEGTAADRKLLKHYVEAFGATPLGGLDFFIDNVSARKLLDKYNWSDDND